MPWLTVENWATAWDGDAKDIHTATERADVKIKFKCACGEPLWAEPQMAGKRGKCPKCGHVFVVPAANQPPAAPGTASSPLGTRQDTVAKAEQSKKKIYAELMTMATDKALKCASEDQHVANVAETYGRSVNLAQAFIQGMESNFARMLDQSYAEIGAKHGLSRAELEAIYREGQKNNWDQR